MVVGQEYNSILCTKAADYIVFGVNDTQYGTFKNLSGYGG
jgi:hypothetical protein